MPATAPSTWPVGHRHPPTTIRTRAPARGAYAGSLPFMMASAASGAADRACSSHDSQVSPPRRRTRRVDSAGFAPPPLRTTDGTTESRSRTSVPPRKRGRRDAGHDVHLLAGSDVRRGGPPLVSVHDAVIGAGIGVEAVDAVAPSPDTSEPAATCPPARPAAGSPAATTSSSIAALPCWPSPTPARRRS